MKKLKILWFSNTAASGEEFLYEKALGGGWLKSLDKAIKNKVELHVAFHYPKTSISFDYNGVSYYPIGEKNWKFSIIKNIFITPFKDDEDLSKYLKIINLVKPDLIHIHGTENSFGCILGKTNIPILYSIQGNYSVVSHRFFSGIELKYSRFKHIDSFKNFLLKKSYFNDYKMSIKGASRERKYMGLIDNVIGRTSWDYRITRILSPNSTYYHNDEILRNIFYQSQWFPNFESTLYIHTTSGNSFYKGFETIAYALNLLLKMGLKVQWTVAGIAPNDPIVKAVKMKLKEDFPKTGFKLLGGLVEEDLVEALKSASIYVMPSHIENSPNNLCEAMILGMPCIATFAGGTGSIMVDGKEGILIQDGDPWAMAGAIIEMNSDRDKAINMGKLARQKALLRHNPDKIVGDLVDIYKKILNK